MSGLVRVERPADGVVMLVLDNPKVNALSTALAQVIVDYNAVVTQLNALLASERAAKQLAP